MNNIKTSKAENTKTNIIKALEQLSKDQNLDNIKIRDICTCLLYTSDAADEL